MRRAPAAVTAGLFVLSASLMFTAPAIAAGGSNAAPATAATTAEQVVAASFSPAAKPKPKAYKNCTALNKVYKHGVARKGGKDKVRGKTKPVKNFTVYTKTYNLNKKSDRDKDGVACEKR